VFLCMCFFGGFLSVEYVCVSACVSVNVRGSRCWFLTGTSKRLKFIATDRRRSKLLLTATPKPTAHNNNNKMVKSALKAREAKQPRIFSRFGVFGPRHRPAPHVPSLRSDFRALLIDRPVVLSAGSMGSRGESETCRSRGLDGRQKQGESVLESTSHPMCFIHSGFYVIFETTFSGAQPYFLELAAQLQLVLFSATSCSQGLS